MTSVSYAVGASNASQEYFSNISSVLRLWEGAERQSQTAQGAVLSPQRGVANTVPFAPECVGCSHVFRKRPQGVAQMLSAAEQGEAERLCDGCPCVGAEEICGAPSPPCPCRSVDNAVPSAYPLRVFPPPAPKKGQTFNLRSHTQFCYRRKVVLPACASSSPGAVPPHPCLVEPQAPLHAHHAERKTKANVFEVD